MAKGEEIVRQAVELRAEGKFSKAIKLVEASLDSFDGDTRVPGLLQAYYAAKEGGFSLEAKKFARLIADEEPDVPSIQGDL